MGNVLEFFIKMKDMMSGGLAKLSTNAQSSFKKIQDGIDKTQEKTKGLGQGFSVAGNGLLKFVARLGLVTSAATMLATAVAFAGKSVEKAAQYEAKVKSFEVLSGNRGIGQALAGELNTMQQNTILGPEVFRNAQTMMSFGIGAKDVVKNMKMLGDVAGGDVERLNSLTLAFSQVQSAGKLSGQDLLQFINAGFNPLNEISKTTGKSMAVLKKEMENGAISSQMVSDAFKNATSQGGLFYNMMDKMAETTAGKNAQLEGSYEALQIELGQRLLPLKMQAVTVLTSWVNKARDFVKIPVAQTIGEQIGKIRALQTELTASNTSHARQLEIFNELQQINPKIVEGIDKQSISYSKLAENVNNVTGALQKKIFLENFDKTNGGIITEYAKAQQKVAESFANSMVAVGQADPGLAQRTDLSLGQKQLLARKILEQKIKSGNVQSYTTAVTGSGMGYGQQMTTSSVEADLLQSMNSYVKENKGALATITKLQPKINEINQTRDALTAQIDKYTGVSSMSTADIKGGGKGNGKAGAGDTNSKSVASGITGGGPRVVNINGVKFLDKLADKLEINNQGDLNAIEDKLQEMFLRILNSGASVQ